MINGYFQALKELNQHIQLLQPDFKPKSYLNLAVQRLTFNKTLLPQSLDEFDVLIGSDFDGFTISHFKGTKVVFNAGILADIVRFERGKIAKILSHLARRECQNVQSAKLVIVPSAYTAKKVAELYRVSPDKIRIIPMGFDHSFWAKLRQKVKVKTRKPPGILCVARQYPRKGIDDLLKSFALVLNKMPQARLTIVGGGPQEKANKELAQSLKIWHTVTFTGDLTDQKRLAEYYANADVFCLPSKHETFGLVFLEAMYFGLPIVAYRSTAVPEVVGKKEGILCTTGNVEEISQNLLTLLQNSTLRQKMGEAGRKKVNKFSWKISAERLLENLQQIKTE